MPRERNPEAWARVCAEREAQGLPRVIEDKAALEALGRIFAAVEPVKPAASE